MNTTGMFTTEIAGRNVAADWVWGDDERGRYVHLDAVYDVATGDDIIDELTDDEASELCQRIRDDAGEYAERLRCGAD